MKWRPVAIGLIIFALALGGGYWAYIQFFQPEESAALAVEEGSEVLRVDNNLVSAEGVLLPLAEAKLSFQTGGQLVAVLVEDGAVVSAGDPLLKLDSVDEEIGVSRAETAVTQAEANLQTAQANLSAAQTALTAAQTGVAAAEAQLSFVEAGATSAQIAVSEQFVNVAQAGVAQAAGSQSAVVESATSGAVSAAEAQLRAAQAQYDNAIRAYQPVVQDVDADEDAREQAQLQLNAATASLQSAQANLDEVLAGAVAGERRAAAAGVQVAVNQRDAAQAQLDLLLAGAKPEQIELLQASVMQAEVAVVEAELRIVQAETAVSQAEAKLIEAQAALTAAQSALDKRTLTAPFDGTVASVIAKEGQVVSPGVPVLMLADLSGWKVETTDLTELNVVSLSPGFEVDVMLDAFPSEELRGTVTDIATKSDVLRGDVTYVVSVDLDAPDALPLRWGMTAFVTIDAGQ